ncbi:MAG: hypothetical protein ING52_15800 [Burkholderiales bacterium]|nr:hypothetical protein [Burkholderiales bacterium]
MGEITTVGIDLAKNDVSVHGVDAHGKTESFPTRYEPGAGLVIPTRSEPGGGERVRG